MYDGIYVFLLHIAKVYRLVAFRHEQCGKYKLYVL